MRHHDESDARIRPNPRGSRPRTKRRPGHLDAVPGWVTGIDRGRFTVEVDDSQPITAVKARELGRRGIVIGDRVQLVGDLSGDEGTLARIVSIEERKHILRRSADDIDSRERIVVVGADRLGIVTSCAEPDPNPRLVDRCLVAAFDADLTPLLILTKGDLASPEPLAAMYQPLGVEVLSTKRRDGQIEGLQALKMALTGAVTVLVGPSGVGKSTLVNALVPDTDRATGKVNVVTGKGRHTSSSAVALRLPGSGWIIDTPGLRTFGLAHVQREHVLAAFPEIALAALSCARRCPHLGGGDGCTLDDWADSDGKKLRLESLRRLLRGIGSEPL